MAPRRTKTAREAKLEAKLELAQTKQFASAEKWSNAMKTLSDFGRYAMFIGIAYFVKEGVVAAAGKATSFNSAVDWVFKMDLSEKAAWALTAVFGGAWYVQRKTKSREVKQLSAYTKELEATIDPRRSTSHLSAEGRPAKIQKPEDD